MLRSWPRRLLTGVATTALLAPAGGSTIGDSFETPAAAGGFVRYPAGTQLGPWTVTTGNVDLTTTALWQAAEGRQSLDLDGDAPGAVARTIATTPLLTYRITYALAGNYVGAPAVKTGEVRANGKVIQEMSFDTTGRYRDSMGYLRQTAYVLAKSSSLRLEFASTTTPGDFGPVIDDVRVDSCLLVLCPKAGAPAA
jgi:choice-of-anchor C domain-containing protein